MGRGALTPTDPDVFAGEVCLTSWQHCRLLALSCQGPGGPEGLLRPVQEEVGGVHFHPHPLKDFSQALRNFPLPELRITPACLPSRERPAVGQPRPRPRPCCVTSSSVVSRQVRVPSAQDAGPALRTSPCLISKGAGSKSEAEECLPNAMLWRIPNVAPRYLSHIMHKFKVIWRLGVGREGGSAPTHLIRPRRRLLRNIYEFIRLEFEETDLRWRAPPPNFI